MAATEQPRVSTNPFRKATAPAAVVKATVPTQPFLRHPTTATAAVAVGKVAKKVRVQSPPPSPVSLADRPHQPWTRPRSSSPPTTFSDDDDDEGDVADPFGEPKSDTATAAPQPLNPFSRTPRDPGLALPANTPDANLAPDVLAFSPPPIKAVALAAAEATPTTFNDSLDSSAAPRPRLLPPPLPPSRSSKSLRADQRDGPPADTDAAPPRGADPPPVPQRPSIAPSPDNDPPARTSMDSTRSRSDSVRLAALALTSVSPPPLPPPLPPLPRRPVVAARKSSVLPPIQPILSPSLMSPGRPLVSPSTEADEPDVTLSRHYALSAFRPPLPPTRQSSVRRGAATASASGLAHIRLGPAGGARDRDRDQSAPPRPPPPRQRGSSRGSADGVPEVPGPRPVPALDHGNGVDILADLHTLQKEVDALRGRVERAGGSS